MEGEKIRQGYFVKYSFSSGEKGRFDKIPKGFSLVVLFPSFFFVLR